MFDFLVKDSLLSRFDLLFIVLDLVDVEQDRRIADHVVRMHRYRSSHEQDGDPLPLAMNIDMLSTNNPDETEATVQDTPIYEKYDALLHGNSRSKTDKIVSMQFMKKYIHVARALKVNNQLWLIDYGEEINYAIYFWAIWFLTFMVSWFTLWLI